MNDTYKENFSAILQLPIVKKLLKKNKKLEKENKSLKNLIYSLPEFRRNDNCNNCCNSKCVKIKKEPIDIIDLTNDENITYSFENDTNVN